MSKELKIAALTVIATLVVLGVFQLWRSLSPDTSAVDDILNELEENRQSD